jgi:MOSC domain-containing protein YiiM
MNTAVASSQILLVSVAKPKTLDYGRRQVSTSIFKEPVQGRIVLRKLNLDGDEQADLTVHGGPDKALYIYPSEHYPWWRQEMPDVEFGYGKFGENLTTTGLLEEKVCIGDQFRMGTAIVQVSQPRLPCYKLGIRFGCTDIIKKFTQSCKSGIYFSVVQEGELGVGDSIEYLRSDEHRILARDVARLFAGHSIDEEFIQRALNSNLAGQMKMFIADL